MNHDELQNLFRSLEGERVERKRSYDSDALREAICALANDLANRRENGVIFVGQEDDRSCSNIVITDELLKRIAGLRVDGKLTPFPVISVEAINIDGCDVVAIVVVPTDNPPIKLDNVAFVRVGPTTRRATAQEEQTLVEKRRWGNLPFDTHAVIGASIEDIDLRRFELESLPALVSPDSLRENGRTIPERMRALRLLRPDNAPTVSALLLFGKSPSDFFAGAYVQAIRVSGTELTTDFVDQREFFGPVPDQLRQLDEYIQLNIRQPLEVNNSKHSKGADYPIDALRQLIRNAVIHRVYEGTNSPVRISWYADRVEILSPGGPYGQVTADNFGQPGITDYRNPTFAALLKDLGFVERFGIGISIARKSLIANGNPEPQFTVSGTHIHAIVRAAL